MADKQDWYFTFGGGQPNEDYYVVVKASLYDEARDKMVREYGIVWSGQYTVPQFMYYGLHEKLTWLKDID